MNRRLIIKKLLREAVGVPSDLMKATHYIYDAFISKLSSFDPSDEEPQHRTIKFSNPISLGDMVFDKVKFNFNIILSSQLDEVIILGWNTSERLAVDGTKIIGVGDYDTIDIGIRLAGPDDRPITNDEVINAIKKDETNSVSSISHELIHIYNQYKEKYRNIIQLGQYSAYSSINFNIRPINTFLRYLYFITNAENLVRPGEIYSIMVRNKINKQGFYDALLNTRTFKTLKDIENFSYEKFREELKNHMSEIERIFNHLDINYSDMSEDEKVDKILELLLINISNKTMSSMVDAYTTPIERVFGLSDDKTEVLSKLEKTARKFVNNPEKYYLYQQKRMNMISKKVIQKISKVYSLLESKNNSIVDWDAHLKYGVGKKPIDTELKSYREKRV